MIWALLSLLSFALSWAGIWIVARRFSDRLIDVPNPRSSHTQPTPRGGGIAFVAAFLVTSAIATFVVTAKPGGTPSLLEGSILVLMPLWAVGAVDDARGLSVRLRYLVQLVSAGLAVFLFGPFPGFDALLGQLGAPWLTPLLSVIAFTAVINFYNFMDGLDGLVGGCCAVQLAFFALYLNQLGWWLLVAALVAFLFWNWPPAKIFMGDSGSTVLGGAVGLALLGTPDARTMWWAGAVTAPLLGDAVLTLLRRLFKRENIFDAHRSHVYQRLNQSGWSHGRVASIYVALTMLIAGLVMTLS
jgi:UDP-N-acetylmuramyl pentapeptide phosphotransferase/UDP-N-acetylglucosamine-1-phosphate transferase